MQKKYIPFGQIDYLSKSDVAYAQNSPTLRPFYKYDVSLESFGQVIADKQKDQTNRAVLYQVLKAQYSTVSTTAAVLENIEKLQSDRTFTVITAHQPSLFTGPLYFIYKIVTAVNLAKDLAQQYPDYQFVPVFVLGSEDHDFEEINHLHLFNKNISWENTEQGPTGMMNTDTLAPTLAEIKEVIGDSENAEQIFEWLTTAYASGKTYAQATFEFVNQLFQGYGLVVTLMNDRALKREFVPIMKAELLQQASKSLVNSVIAEKEAAGWKAQATPRDINLFYMQKGFRERIVLEDGIYKVLNRAETFTEKELLQELETFPERFSPNVVLRPLFQELIFPNLCYIGGGGELAYWRERLTQFEHFGLNFPMLLRRNSVLWVDKNSSKKLEKLGLTVDDIFVEIEALIKDFVQRHTSEELSLAAEKTAITAAFDSVLAKAVSIEKNLERSVTGEMTKLLNTFDKLEAKLISAEKRNHDTAIQQIRTVKEKLFPGNGLQERYDNFIAYYLKHGDGFIATLMENLEPLNRDFVVITE